MLRRLKFSANYLHSIEQRMLAEGVRPIAMMPGSAVPFVSVK